MEYTVYSLITVNYDIFSAWAHKDWLGYSKLISLSELPFEVHTDAPFRRTKDGAVTAYPCNQTSARRNNVRL